MRFKALIGVAALTSFAAISSAQLTLITTRGGIGANDSVDWGQFGAPGTFVTSPSFGVSGIGMPFELQGINSLETAQEGVNWGGNFASGDNLMFSGFDPFGGQNNGTIDMTFGQTVFAAGAQIQQNQHGSQGPVAFTATITAYDGIGTNLGSVSESGISNFTEDNSAIFIGVESTRADIARIVFTVNGASTDGEGFAVNSVSIQQCNPVPEPASLAVLGLGAVALLRRKRR